MNLIDQNLIVVLAGYLKQLITIAHLKEWLGENIWELADSTSPLDRMIVGELELALAEYDRGDRDESYVRKSIWVLLQLPNPNLSPILEEVMSTGLAA